MNITNTMDIQDARNYIDTPGLPACWCIAGNPALFWKSSIIDYKPDFQFSVLIDVENQHKLDSRDSPD